MDMYDHIIEHRKGQHLLAEERHEIEVRSKDGWSPYRIAKHLGRAYNTIKDEIVRGAVYHYDGKVAQYKAEAGDNGSEFTRLAELATKGTNVYFTHPDSSWEKGTNATTSCCADPFPRESA